MVRLGRVTVMRGWFRPCRLAKLSKNEYPLASYWTTDLFLWQSYATGPGGLKDCYMLVFPWTWMQSYLRL